MFRTQKLNKNKPLFFQTDIRVQTKSSTCMCTLNGYCMQHSFSLQGMQIFTLLLESTLRMTESLRVPAQITTFNSRTAIWHTVYSYSSSSDCETWASLLFLIWGQCPPPPRPLVTVDCLVVSLTAPYTCLQVEYWEEQRCYLPLVLLIPRLLQSASLARLIQLGPRTVAATLVEQLSTNWNSTWPCSSALPP